MHATTPSTQPPQSCKVVIIGAGFAGLAAGTTLCNPNTFSPTADPDNQTPHKFSTEDVVILEASDRVGGRAHTLSLSDTLSVELGCTWLHGIGTIEQPNPILAAATAAGLMTATPQPQKWWGSTFLLPHRTDELSKEEKILVHKAIEAYAAAVEGIESTEKVQKLSEKASEGGITSEGKKEISLVGTAVDAAWRTFIQTEQLHSNPVHFELARAAWQWREQLQRAIDGCDSTHDVEATARALYTEFGESEVHAPIPCGYQRIAEALAAGEYSSLPSLGTSPPSSLSSPPPPPLPLNIKLNHEVELIEWGNNNEDTNTGVLITCTNGAQYKASAAIITTSLGVLKQRHEKMFSPKLPERKIQAINNLKIGVVDKIIVDFSELDQEKEEENVQESGSESEHKSGSYLKADRGVVTYALLWEDDELSTTGLPEWARGIFSVRWGGPEFKRRRKTSGERADTATAAAAEEEEEESDDDKHPSSVSLPPKYSQAVMWITGDAARSMEQASDDQVIDTVKQIFKIFPGIALPLKQNQTEGGNVTATDEGDHHLWDRARLTRSQWGLNHLTAGSYSYVGPTGSPEDVTALKSVCSGGSGSSDDTPVLLFAGEACHVQYIGTTHAAYLTGQEAAEVLLKAEGRR